MSTALIFDTKTGQVTLRQWSASFSYGRDGTIPAEEGREGDAKTPLGQYRLRFGLFRPDRLPRPETALTLHPMKATDGWCDAPDHSAYNRWVQCPFPASHEPLWRDDGAYDVVLVISHNDSPPIPGLGSCVFIHCRQPDHRPTLGCVALGAPDMCTLLPKLYRGLAVDFR